MIIVMHGYLSFCMMWFYWNVILEYPSGHVPITEYLCLEVKTSENLLI